MVRICAMIFFGKTLVARLMIASTRSWQEYHSAIAFVDRSFQALLVSILLELT